MNETIVQEIDASEHLISMTPVSEIVRLGHVLGIDNSFRVLDLCCGYGELLRILSKYYGCSGDGVDISKGQLRAPVGQTTSHWVHQPHSSVSIMVITLSMRTRALQ